ncbi:hypothetical protein K523DRAFT_408705 [Schizophyllum commune Tattone D]|nr:hypothetical protein K523DRAFT_408705 [Schizophyllum commune Tattone D]
MPLMSTCMIFDHEEDIAGFVNGCCGVCGKFVQTKRAQKSHSRTFHLNQNIWSNVVKTRPFPCPYCSYRAAQSGTLGSHICAKHTHEQPHICEVCGYATAHAASMSRHKKKHGGTNDDYDYEDEEDGREQPEAPHTVQRDTVCGGPDRATRSTKRYTPYTKQAANKPNKPKATKKVTSSENYAQGSPRPLSPTYEAQPVQQKDVYDEVHPSQYEQNQHYNAPANSYPSTAPANSYNPNAPADLYYPPATSGIYPPVPSPTYNTPAPACNQQAPVYPPAAYYNNYAPATAPNTTYASASSYNQASSSSSSFHIAEDSSVPQLSASDIKFAGISFPAGANQQAIAYEVLPAAQVDAYPAVQTDAFSAAAAELEVNASWYYAEEFSPYNAQEFCSYNTSSSPYGTSSSPYDTSPYNTSSPLENLSFDATASSPEDYGLPATPIAPAALNFAQEPLIEQTQQQSFPIVDLVQQKSSPEPMIDFSQGSMLDLSFDFSQESTFDFSMLDSTQQPYIDFSQLELDFSKMGDMDFSNMGDLDPNFGNYSPESNAPYTSSASYSSPQSNPPPTKEELGWLFDEFIVAGPMA